MSSTLAMFDMLPVADFSTYKRPVSKKRRPGTCERCGRELPPCTSHNTKIVRRFCCELCRKRAEKARWKARRRAALRRKAAS